MNAQEIRDLVAKGKAHGLIRTAGTVDPVAKNGAPASAPLGKLLSQWIDVTPEVAARWLKNNFRNRPISEDVVAAYARDMTNGVWVPTHQGVAFNDRDELIDGQHRLSAIVRSGKTVRMMVTFGLASTIAGSEMTTMDAVDRGRTRSVADQLKIQHGMKNGAVIAGMCATIGGICHGERTRRLSVGQTLEIYRAFQEPMDWVIAIRTKQPGFKSAGFLGAFAFALATESRVEIDPAPVAEMYRSLVEGKKLPPRTAAAALRAFLTSDEATLLSRGSDRGLAELVLNAIFLQVRGAKVDLLTLVQDGANHYRAAQPERVAKIAAMFKLPAAAKVRKAA